MRLRLRTNLPSDEEVHFAVMALPGILLLPDVQEQYIVEEPQESFVSEAERDPSLYAGCTFVYCCPGAVG